MQDMDAAADVSEMSPKAVGGATGDLFAATRKTTAEPQPEPQPEPESGPVEAKESSSMADPEYSADFEDAPAEYSDTFEDPETLSKSKLSAGGSPKPSPPRDPAPPAAKAKVGGLRGLLVPGVRVPFGIACTLMVGSGWSR